MQGGRRECSHVTIHTISLWCLSVHSKFFSQTSFWGRKGGTQQSCNMPIFLGVGVGRGELSHVSCIYVTQCSQCIPFYCCYFCSCNFSHFGSKFCNFWIKGKVQNIFLIENSLCFIEDTVKFSRKKKQIRLTTVLLLLWKMASMRIRNIVCFSLY